MGTDPGLAKELSLQVREEFVDPGQWRAYDDVFPALDGLSALGWTHLVLSNHVPGLPEIVGGLGLDGRISHIFNSAETGHEKPHPEAYRNVLRTLKSPGAMWMIGDNMGADVTGAEATGIPAVLVRRPHPGAAPVTARTLPVYRRSSRAEPSDVRSRGDPPRPRRHALALAS